MRASEPMDMLVETFGSSDGKFAMNISDGENDDDEDDDDMIDDLDSDALDELEGINQVSCVYCVIHVYIFLGILNNNCFFC